MLAAAVFTTPLRAYTWGRLSMEAYTSKYSSMRSPTSMRVESGVTSSMGRSYCSLSSIAEPLAPVVLSVTRATAAPSGSSASFGYQEILNRVNVVFWLTPAVRGSRSAK